MRTFLRTVLSLSLIVWIGAEVFFPIVAATTFTTLMPDAHSAGAIVGHLLRVMHWMGLVCGIVALVILAIAPKWKLLGDRNSLWPMALLVLMLAITSYSQFGIIPAMERDRLACGGDIMSVDTANENRVHFEKLHKRSEHAEGAVLLLGLVVVVMLSRTGNAVSHP